MAHTILVMDGEGTQSNPLCVILREKLAYRTICASDVREVAHYTTSAEPSKPDLVIFDVPAVTGGCSVLSNVRTLLGSVPIVALVKYGDYATATAALNNGAQDFLMKPVAIERLGTTLRNTIYLHEARQEISQRHELTKQPYASAAAIDPLQRMAPIALIAEDGNIRTMEQIEAETIRFAMQFYYGRMTEVARRLGIGRSTLYRKLNELGVRQQEAA